MLRIIGLMFFMEKLKILLVIKKISQIYGSFMYDSSFELLFERMFPIVNANKTYLGNSLDISTVSTLLKIKSYYSENDILDVSKYHLTLKKTHLPEDL